MNDFIKIILNFIHISLIQQQHHLNKEVPKFLFRKSLIPETIYSMPFVKVCS